VPSARPAAPEDLVAEAKELAAELVKTFPESPHALTLAGRIHYAFGDATAADACWTACLARNPDFTEASRSLGEAAWEHGNYDKAVPYLQKALAANARPDDKHLLFLADSLLSAGRAQEAARVLEQAAENGPLPTHGLCFLGQAYLETKQYEKAKSRFQETLALDAQSFRAHYGLATVLARLGQPEEARKHRQQYAELKSQVLAQSDRMRAEMRKRDLSNVRPLVRDCHQNAGTICANRARLQEAEEHWLRALALEPQNPQVRKLLELLYREQGRTQEALLISRGDPFGGPAPQAE
jgi:tetratricopeptide (TPR) repeat protein